MASINKVILIGNLGRDPEVKYSAGGTAMCTIQIATSRNWKDKTSGEKKEETEWHRVVFYDRLAEVVGEYLKKGRPIYVEGRLKTRKWEKEGVDHFTTEIIADQMQMLGSKDDGAGGGRDGNTGASRSSSNNQQQRPAGNQARGKQDIDDDIPF